MYIDIESWLASLPPQNRVDAGAIISRCAKSIQEELRRTETQLSIVLPGP